MGFATKALRRFLPKGKRGARQQRVDELQRDPRIQAAGRDGLESERLAQGVRFEDLKRRNA